MGTLDRWVTASVVEILTSSMIRVEYEAEGVRYAKNMGVDSINLYVPGHEEGLVECDAELPAIQSAPIARPATPPPEPRYPSWGSSRNTTIYHVPGNSRTLSNLSCFSNS